MPDVELWDEGENKAVDVAVVASEQLLLIRRGDGGGWALPGGFVDPGESDLDAMVRELCEETGVTVSSHNVQIATNRIPVDDLRNRPDRWITTALGLVRLPQAVTATGGSDASDARWVPLAGHNDMDRGLHAATGVGLYPAHRPLVDEVVKAVAR